MSQEIRTDCDEFSLKPYPNACGDCQTDGHYLCGNCKHIASFEDMELSDNRERYYPAEYKMELIEDELQTCNVCGMNSDYCACSGQNPEFKEPDEPQGFYLSDGTHVLGNPAMDQKTISAIEDMVKIANKTVNNMSSIRPQFKPRNNPSRDITYGIIFEKLGVTDAAMDLCRKIAMSRIFPDFKEPDYFMHFNGLSNPSMSGFINTRSNEFYLSIDPSTYKSEREP